MVFSRCNGSGGDAPIGGQIQVTVYDSAQGIDIRDAFEGFRAADARSICQRRARRKTIAPELGEVEEARQDDCARSQVNSEAATFAVHPDDETVNELMLTTR